MTSLLVAAILFMPPGGVSAHQQAARIYAQALVDQAVARHPEVKAVELAIDSAGVCKTIAGTAKEDIGEKCDEDELEPMRTGEPGIEAPTTEDPVYDITQALHDVAGRLIGAVGMDITPVPGHTRAQALALAQTVLRELEARIPSKQKLFEVMP